MRLGPHGFSFFYTVKKKYIDVYKRQLLQLADQAVIVIVINATDIEKSKVRGDLGITYDADVLRLIDAFRDIGLYVGSVVIAQYSGQPVVDSFKNRLNRLGIQVFLHYPIVGYPNNIPFIVSDEGFGKNEYIETTRPLVIVTAPGPGSGKMATCLSQLYQMCIRDRYMKGGRDWCHMIVPRTYI